MSYGPFRMARLASGKYAISTASATRQQFVLGVQQAQLASVAGGELENADGGFGFFHMEMAPLADARGSACR